MLGFEPNQNIQDDDQDHSDYWDMLDTARRSERKDLPATGRTQVTRYVEIYARVEPAHFLKWAKGKEYEIPEELVDLLNRPEHEQQQETNKKWGYLHDTKLLEIVRWVVEEYWEGKDLKEAPSKDAIVAELKEKYELTQNEATAVDLVTRHDDRRNAKPKTAR